jgi:hypothetical protein
MRAELTPAQEYAAAVAATDAALAAHYEATTGRPFVARPLPVAATWDGGAS